MEFCQCLLFVFGVLVVYCIGCYVLVLGVNFDVMFVFMQVQGGGIVDMFNMFLGGVLYCFSIFVLNVMLYILVLIVMQLVVYIFLVLKVMQKEGELGCCKIIQYFCIGVVFLVVVQGGSIVLVLQDQLFLSGVFVVYVFGMGFVFMVVVVLIVGIIFLMWVGEQVIECGIGNGVLLIIFVGIVVGLFGVVIYILEVYCEGNMSFIVLLLIVLVVLVFIYFVVFVECGQCCIMVNYVCWQGGCNVYMNQILFLLLKLNMVGVILVIFVFSILVFLMILVMWFGQVSLVMWLQKVVSVFGLGELLYMIVFVVLIIGFVFFYIVLVFNLQEIVDNLKKFGVLILGICLGKVIVDYIDGVLICLMVVGLLYLVIVCLLLEIMWIQFGVLFYFGGILLLIVVVVVMDFIVQIQVYLMLYQYESLLKKVNLKGGNCGGFVCG